MPTPKKRVSATSMAAYKAALPELMSAHQIKIIVVLRGSKLGMIAEQIAAQTNLDKHKVGRRTSELIDKGLIEVTHETRKTSSGRKAQVYKITEAGHAYIIPDKYLPGKTIVEYSKAMQSPQLKLL